MYPPVGDPGQQRLRLVHQLRAISVELDLARSAFAQANGLHDTDVRALIALLDERILRRPSAADRRKVELHVSDQAIALGWEFFGPLLTGMMRAMESFSADELGVAEHFLGEVAAATRWTSPPSPVEG